MQNPDTLLSYLSKDLQEVCLPLFRQIQRKGGRAIFIGGWVRDALLGHTSKDVDIEVYGLEVSLLEKVLKQSFNIVEVGKSFGVFKVNGLPIDIALPRRESKTGIGHKGFLVKEDPSLSFREATLRRDFTINAIGFDPLKNEIIDPCHGCTDLAQKMLRHTSVQFSEDPLRVLRAMQLIARLELEAAQETLELCKKITPENIPAERLFEEWKKLITKGIKPSMGLSFLRNCGWTQYYPEIAALIGCEQDSQWHPEGDVWTHTLYCLDAFARERIHDEWEDLIVGLAVLCHDIGKPATTRRENDRIRSKGHETAGEKPTRHFLGRLTEHKELVESVIPLVTHHMRPRELYKGNAGDSAVRRLASRVKRIDRLVRVVKADLLGRPPIAVEHFSEEEWLLKRAEMLAIKDSAPKPIILGRHLIILGEKAGPHFKRILNKCYEAQLDGFFCNLETGMAFANNLLTEMKISNKPSNLN